MFHRWDFAMNVSTDEEAYNFKLFEVNSVDVGGIHYAAAARKVMHVRLSIRAWAIFPPRRPLWRRLAPNSRSRFERSRRAARQTLVRVAIAENQDFTTGITEAESFRKFFCDRGIETQCVDARKINAESFDVVYRNIELRDLADFESAGGDLSGLRAAAKQGKLLSSPFGELDHKSLWEALGPKNSPKCSLLTSDR